MVSAALPIVHRDLASALWNKSPEIRTWMILDAARDERIYRAIERTQQDSCCLFAGRLTYAMKHVAPYLIEADKEERLTRLVLEKGWGDAWGVFLQSSFSLETLRIHFRKFLRVKDQAGQVLLFRYYDPRVLRVYLPTCLPGELETVFGPVHSFLVEDEAPDSILRYKLMDRKLYTSPETVAVNRS